MALTANSAGALAVMLGSLFNYEKIPNLMMVIALLFVIFSGFYKNKAAFPEWIRWFQYFTPFK